MSAPPGRALCRLDDIPDGEGREFHRAVEGETLRVIVVRRGPRAWAYVNECPHQYTPLNAEPDRFVTWDHAWILCAVHGAVFRYEDGLCEDGPCAGRHLRAVPVQVVDGAVVTLD